MGRTKEGGKQANFFWCLELLPNLPRMVLQSLFPKGIVQRPLPIVHQDLVRPLDPPELGLCCNLGSWVPLFVRMEKHDERSVCSTRTKQAMLV